MSRSIAFNSVTRSKYRGFLVHDGEVSWRTPTEVRLDGEPLYFAEPSMIETLHRTLRIGRAIQKRGGRFDCIPFSALMVGDTIPKVKFGGYIMPKPADSTRSISPEEDYTDSQLALGKETTRGFIYPHFVAPLPLENASSFPQLDDTPAYIHKLGWDGPVCISGLRRAMDMEKYKCTVARPVTEDGEYELLNKWAPY